MDSMLSDIGIKRLHRNWVFDAKIHHSLLKLRHRRRIVGYSGANFGLDAVDVYIFYFHGYSPLSRIFVVISGEKNAKVLVEDTIIKEASAQRNSGLYMI